MTSTTEPDARDRAVEDERSHAVVSSYVTHGGRWWNVSTINRVSSAVLAQGARYHETIVWEWNPVTKERGKLVHMGQDYEGSVQYHNETVERLYLTGNPEVIDADD